MHGLLTQLCGASAGAHRPEWVARFLGVMHDPTAYDLHVTDQSLGDGCRFLGTVDGFIHHDKQQTISRRLKQRWLQPTDAPFIDDMP